VGLTSNSILSYYIQLEVSQAIAEYTIGCNMCPEYFGLLRYSKLLIACIHSSLHAILVLIRDIIYYQHCLYVTVFMHASYYSHACPSMLVFK
jgi:hypothetical protein